MARADAARDYYADLELQPTADADEIKKQYRHFAKIYHPDRNPGKEAEFNAKFQAIQQAYEVLSDPPQRAKYDANRIRTGRYNPFGSPAKPEMPPRNPTTGQPYAPPPQRPRPTAANSSFPNGPSSGANRYSRYAWTEATTATDDAKAKTDAYKAWEQMKHGNKPASQQQNRKAPPTKPPPRKPGFPPTPGPGKPPPSPYNTGFDSNNESQAGGSPNVRSAWEQTRDFPPSPGMARSNTTRTPKKTGFAPATPGGDEPAARNSSAYFNRKEDRSHPTRVPTQYPPPPPGPPPGAKPSQPPTPDQYRSFQSPRNPNDPFGSSDRLSTPYATSGGERTYLSGGERTYFSDTLHRSASARSQKASAGSTPGFPPNMKSPLTPEDGRRHRSASPNAKSPNAPRPYSSGSVSSSSDSEVDSKPRRASAGYRTSAQGSFGGFKRPPHPMKISGDTSIDDQREQARRRSRASQGSHVSNGLPRVFAEGAKSRNDSTSSEGFQEHRMRKEAERSQNESAQKIYDPPSSNGSEGPKIRFKIPKNSFTAPPQPFPAPSSENIDTQFTPTDWHGKFTGNPQDYLGPAGSGPVPRGRTSPTKRTHAYSVPKGEARPNIFNGAAKQTVPSQMPPPFIPPPTPQPGSAKFSPEEWQQHFKEPTFVYDPPPRRDQSSPHPTNPRRTKTPRRGSVNQKKPTVPKPASVSAAIDDSGEDAGSSAVESERGSSVNGSAMDIDPTLTPPSEPHRKPDLAGPPKSKPGRKFSNETPPSPFSQALPKAPLKTTLQDTGASDLNLGSLKNVEPLAPSGAGLKNLTDINTTLPFESRPSDEPIVSITPSKLDLPRPPKAPHPPEPLNSASWHIYCTSMQPYMNEWATFNKRMLAHFNARQEEVGGLGSNWIPGRGGEGYAKYMRGVEEDFRVRAHWEVSWEKHRECMHTLGSHREKAIRGGLSVS